MKFYKVGCLTFLLFLSACDNGHKEMYSKMENSDFKCPSNSESEISGWGERGLLRSCKTRNGRWQAWSEGILRIDGYYLNDKKHGQWTWYTKDGLIEKKIIYKDGVEVKSELINQ